MSAHIIVLGNEKGGSGKTTSAMHLIISLLKLGFRVGSIDIDSRQQSLTRYIENRALSKTKNNLNLEVPEHMVIAKSKNPNIIEGNKEEEEKFLSALNNLKENNDFIVIDTPGSDAPLSRIAHSYADTLVTPINESFIDVDLLGKISADNLEVITPGIYSAMFWEQKLRKAARNRGEIRWVVVKNRVSSLDTLNRRNIEASLVKLAKKLGFIVAPGFSDRVIFKELFLHGLTLHDAGTTNLVRINTSMIAARQELREFIQALKIKEITEKIAA
ncbi:chromosome partitioning protein [endosymbiont of Acanthamoeba sp. UWC8]|uniref:division plane positioning ATPase MipZ n=1 Tax=endosymbiont of Acanthamoeba sp. UWC8 TaxID=86106 RepID=UPI0004D155C6|nr:division plane positioning ATPase MipZ [endosymbiont of Acanthamoeba sp. UWC8]AIF80930.1 chromosome partitioning protein [endosymbiont of Acanthamoeba sp. UWC8]